MCGVLPSLQPPQSVEGIRYQRCNNNNRPVSIHMERTVEVVPEAGIHARPASRFVQKANEFEIEVSIGRADAADGQLVSAKSMLSVTGLNIEHGESVRIVTDAPEASEALEELAAILTAPTESENV